MNVCIMPRPMGFIYSNQDIPYFLSRSVLEAVNEMKSKIDETNVELMEICKIINPHEYVFSSVSENGVPTLAVSKITPPSNFYYELREIINSFGLLRMVYTSVLYLSESVDNTMQLLFNNSTRIFTEKCICAQQYEPVDIIIIDSSTDVVPYIGLVLSTLNNDSPLIIKISNITNKGSIQMLYLLSTVFEKVYMVKPSVANIMSDDIFIVCISLLENYKDYIDVNLNMIEIPLIFLSKIEEFNSINGHMQLDAYEQVFNILYNKNKWTKMDTLKKSNIQKSQSWCDKNNVPYNKLGDKVNIFLHT